MSLLEAYAAGWALVDEAPVPTERNIVDLMALEGLCLAEAVDAGERSARRAALERARERLYHRRAKAVKDAGVALLIAYAPIDHLASSLVLMGAKTASKPARRDQAMTVLGAALWASPQALAAWQDANGKAWAAAVVRGQAEAQASTEAGPPLPAQVTKLARELAGETDTNQAPSDWVSRQVARVAWHLSNDDLYDHEDPAAAIRRSIEQGDPITASAEDLMHEALSRAFVDHFYAGSGTNLGMLAWVTEMDERVCPLCDALEAEGPYHADEVPDMPAHPLCRCHFERE